METLSQVKPAIGMSVSMGIGSDSYHQIIVKMERNAKMIYTMPARTVLGGVAQEDWNALPESIKAKRAEARANLANQKQIWNEVVVNHKPVVQRRVRNTGAFSALEDSDDE